MTTSSSQRSPAASLDSLSSDILALVGHEERHEFGDVFWLLDPSQLHIALYTERLRFAHAYVFLGGKVK